jgi:5-methylcytosine-specific restriction endonuclease McrA
MVYYFRSITSDLLPLDYYPACVRSSHSKIGSRQWGHCTSWRLDWCAWRIVISQAALSRTAATSPATDRNRPLNQKFPKQRRKRLEPYRQLRQEILRRDGWRCQACGRRRDLQVHHIESRSHLGNDCEQNLITLCADCQRWMHGVR